MLNGTAATGVSIIYTAAHHVMHVGETELQSITAAKVGEFKAVLWWTEELGSGQPKLRVG